MITCLIPNQTNLHFLYRIVDAINLIKQQHHISNL